VHAQIIAKLRPEEALVLLKQAKDTGMIDVYRIFNIDAVLSRSIKRGNESDVLLHQRIGSKRIATDRQSKKVFSST